MPEPNLAAVAASPACGRDLTIGGSHDRASPTRAKIDPRMEAGKMQDRVIAIAEI